MDFKEEFEKRTESATSPTTAHDTVTIEYNSFEVPVDGDKFVKNNWIEDPSVATLKALDLMGVSVWLNTDGEYSCRMSPNGVINKMPASKLRKVISSKLKRPIDISEAEDADIKSFDILLVSDDTFDPQCKQEFHEKEGEVYRNSFRPTPFMELDKQSVRKNPSAILAILHHLTKGNVERVAWIVNWLAYFFQGLKKSPVALFLKGPQGSSKGILYDDILVPLFGKTQCMQVNDKTMKGSFLGSIVEGKLLLNLDEISSGIQNNKEFKNQLKALISNRAGTFEKKFKNTEKETPLYAMILITSNEPKALEIEHRDRRLTVYETGKNIAKINFLGYGSYKALITAITAELEDFALMLLQHDVDVALATTAQETPEKEALVGVSSNRFKSFSNAMKAKDIDFFIDVQEETFNNVYDELQICFNKNRLSRKLLKQVYAPIYGPITTNSLMEQLRAVCPTFWNETTNSVKTAGGDYMFKLDSECNDSYIPAIPANNTTTFTELDGIQKPSCPSLIVQ